MDPAVEACAVAASAAAVELQDAVSSVISHQCSQRSYLFLDLAAFGLVPVLAFALAGQQVVAAFVAVVVVVDAAYPSCWAVGPSCFVG